MKIRCTRNTGFYGMGSPIEIRKNNEKWFYLSQNQTKQVEVEESECMIQAKFFLLKSVPFKVIDQEKIIDLELTMNPILILSYVILFVSMFLISVLQLKGIGVLLVLVTYVIFLYLMLNRAYIIKEKK
ncbi:hypothetical protein [Candidatus Enterococcus mansonii]|uniref:Uncharacterized protein n=1 Tax=Candidatus Enterococcus mansonii TaxID=1834181 RepID=A0A242CK84_9ENTE|nr:hypothetical protein [Enterococcus sp. 4G2_DIV0659]OTO10569.1 hypothetical protein A5880_001253 [Enterococcus sp. 4G2_DIV0659]